MRLNQFIARAGICSRREADRLIADGRVIIDGRTARPGLQVEEGQTIIVDGKLVSIQEPRVVLAYYKPMGVTCTERDAHAERMVTDEIDYPIRVTYAGRLDKESEGLLLLSNDGRLIQSMMKGAYGHEREYLVRTREPVTEAFVRAMEAGLYIKELDITTKPCKVEKIDNRRFKIILTQGVNRQIRRMCRTLGFHVIHLKRTRVINITLGYLKPGEYRELSTEEIENLEKELLKNAAE